MKIKWIRVVLVLGLILALTACVQPTQPGSEADEPAPQAELDDDQGDQAAADNDAADHDDNADMDDDQAEGEDADTDDADSGDTGEESEPAPPPIDVAEIYANNCSGCHGPKREGGAANRPLLPESLTEDAPYYANFISEGSKADTRMGAWKAKLSPEVIAALSEWILTPEE